MAKKTWTQRKAEHMTEQELVDAIERTGGLGTVPKEKALTRLEKSLKDLKERGQS